MKTRVFFHFGRWISTHLPVKNDATVSVRQYCVGERRPDIREFYAGKTVLLTGGTGFTGKHALYKLLRSCPELERVYCLVRPSKGLTALDRLSQTILADDLFMYTSPQLRRKVEIIEGDVSCDGLGLSSPDRQKLLDECNIILHAAASTTLLMPLREAVNVNTLGTKRLMELGHQMRKLDSMVYVSTAFANLERMNKALDEVIYDLPFNKDQIIEWTRTKTDEQMEKIFYQHFRNYRSTYLLSKALTEHVIMEEHGGLPVCIARPPLIGSTCQEPFPGWVDRNIRAAFNFLVIQYLLGHFRLAKGHKNILGLVPLELVTNATVAAAWRTALWPQATPIIYNTCPTMQEGSTWMQIFDAAKKSYKEQPPVLGSMAPSANTMVQSECLKHVQKMKAWGEAYRVFYQGTFDFKNDNLHKLHQDMSEADKKTFWCLPEHVDWQNFLDANTWGTRKYLLNESINIEEKLNQYQTREQVSFND